MKLLETLILSTSFNKILAQIRDSKLNSVQINVDENEFDNKWQQMGVCGIPSVEVDKSIMTGISQNIWEKVQAGLETQGAGVRSSSTGILAPGSSRSPIFQKRRINGASRNMLMDRLEHFQNGDEGETSPDQSLDEQAAQLIHQTQNARIVGGRISTPDTWPWQVHLTLCGKWYGYIECNVCGASILSPNWLLSAGHCVPENPSGYSIYGTNDIKSSTGRRGMLKDFIVHPDYNPTNFDKDLSLIKPLYQMVISAASTPVCLPHKNTCWNEHTACVVTGWGLTDEKSSQFPDKLREVAVRLISKEKCQRYTYYDKILTDNMLCAGYSEGGKDACAGDSGGPLVCRIPKTSVWVLAGTVSWGYGCARPGSPGVYTNLRLMTDWIKSVSQLGPDDKLNLQSGDYNEELISTDSKCFRTSRAEEAAFEDRDMDKLIDSFWKGKHNTRQLKQAITDGRKKVAEKFNRVPNKDISFGLNCENTMTGIGPNFNITKYLFEQGKVTESSTSLEIAEAAHKFQGTLHSKNYPSPHPSRCNCQYTIPNTLEGSNVVLHLKDANSQCHKKNFVVIKEIGGRSRKYCAIRKQFMLKSSKGFIITWKTNMNQVNTNFKGFQLDFKFEDATHMCAQPKSNWFTTDRSLAKNGDPFHSSKNYNKNIRFSTPNFPRAYQPNSQCRWHLNVANPGKEILVLDFIRGIHTERRVPCGTKNDNLIFFESEDCTDTKLETAKIWGTMCGYHLKRKTIEFATEKGLCVVWVADADRFKGRGAVFNVRAKRV